LNVKEEAERRYRNDERMDKLQWLENNGREGGKEIKIRKHV
jgi:hypothetical protein